MTVVGDEVGAAGRGDRDRGVVHDDGDAQGVGKLPVDRRRPHVGHRVDDLPMPRCRDPSKLFPVRRLLGVAWTAASSLALPPLTATLCTLKIGEARTA